MGDLFATSISYQPSGWATQQTQDQHALMCTVWPQYLTLREAVDILNHFSNESWLKDQQVLWSGTDYASVQKAANENGMQTLRSAMGPLMDPGNPACLKSLKSAKQWSTYIKGASLVFAWRISQGEVVTIITPPPPDCFHPSEMTNLQDIELPVLHGCLGNRPVGRILLWHPTIKGAETFRYQIWPDDQMSSWYEKFGPREQQKKEWRLVSKTRVSTKWAVKMTVRRLIAFEMLTRFKSFLFISCETLFFVVDELVLLIKLSVNSICLLIMILRLLVRTLVSEEDWHGAGQNNFKSQDVNSDQVMRATVTEQALSSKAIQSTRLGVLDAAEAKETPLTTSTVDTSAMTDQAGSSTRSIPTAPEIIHTPITVSMNFSAPAEGGTSSPKRSKAATKRLKRLQREEMQRQRKESEARGKNQNKSAGTS